jgi:MscS family membrane protein
MYFGTRFLPLALLFLVLSLFSASQCLAQKTAPPLQTEAAAAPANLLVNAGQGKITDQGNAALQPEEVPVPINAEKIDEAAEALGKRIDHIGLNASIKVGRWIDAKAFYGITWLKLFVCFGLVLLVMALERSVRYAIAMRLNRKAGICEARWGDRLLEAVSRPISLFIRVYGIYWALSPIWSYFDSPGGSNLVHRLTGKAADLGGTIAFFWFLYRFILVIDCQIRRWVASTDNSINEMLVPLVSKTVRGFVIVIGGMLVLQNVSGIEIGPLVASLGIGGLAFALAGKDSIANFLGSLTILLDKPFHTGERIVIDKHDGFVEGVGFRSTRLRTLQGSLVSIPNEKIINSPLENIGRRTHLRWQTDLALICETPPEKIEMAVEIIQDILRNHEGMHEDYPPRVFFNGFNDWNLNISVHAWYFPADYWKYQEWIQKTCLEIMRRFRRKNIEFAYPTQAVYQLGQEQPLELAPKSVARL